MSCDPLLGWSGDPVNVPPSLLLPSDPGEMPMPDEPAGPTGGPEVAALGPPPGVGPNAGPDAGEPPRPPAPPSRRRRWLRRIATGLLVLLGIAAIAGLFIHLPYRIISPGSATPLDQEVVSVRGAS